MARDVANVFAVGVNCIAPRDANELVELAATVSGKPVVVYPNSGERWDAQQHAWSGGGSFQPPAVAAWVWSGARLVGGCCRVSPADIDALAATVRAEARE
jgi:homocysteine S-methyltransferase